jgi:cell division septation protein DedD
MQFLKQNYEKIVLALVIIVALGVVAFLPIMVSKEKKKLDDLENSVTVRNPKPLPPVDLKREDAFVARSKTAVSLNLSQPHKIFNPVRFQLKADRTLLRNPAGTEIEQLKVTKITPLYEVYSFMSPLVSPGMATHYGIGIKHEAAASISQRNVKTTYAALKQTTNNFTILSAEGPEEEPTGVTMRLSDTGETVTVTKDKPYERVEGYTADLIYEPEKKPFLNRRKTDTSSICFAGECYKIVDIGESEVVLLQLSNQKTWTIRAPNQTNSTAAASQP